MPWHALRLLCVSGKVAALVAAGAMASIGKSKQLDRPGAGGPGAGGPGAGKGVAEEDVLVCVNVAMTKTALKVDVCALPTDVAYNRCTHSCVLVCGALACFCACTPLKSRNPLSPAVALGVVRGIQAGRQQRPS